MKKIGIISLLLAVVMLLTTACVSCGMQSQDTKETLEEVPETKDPSELYQNAKDLFDNKKYEEALSIWQGIKEYNDSKAWIEKCENALLELKYDDAVSKLNAGNIVEAYEILISLGGYKDSADKAASIADRYHAIKKETTKAGDIISFGHYEQDKNVNNGKEKIEWIVLKVENGKALVLSKYVLDFKAIAEKSPYTWITGGIREWMNGTFYESAFDAREQSKIVAVTLTADPIKKMKVFKDSDTQDKIFALNLSELNEFIPESVDRKAEWTPYAKAESPFSDSSEKTCDWWLRVVSTSRKNAYSVNLNGGVEAVYGNVKKGMRPAMWIELGD